ncbi:hypothetical protein PMAYCL1PPCAC_01328, partial [Pristionchus mayeri]
NRWTISIYLENGRGTGDELCLNCSRTTVVFSPRKSTPAHPGFHFRLIATVYFWFLLPHHDSTGVLYYGIVWFFVCGRRRVSIAPYCKCFDAKSFLLCQLDALIILVTVLYATGFLALALDEAAKLVQLAIDGAVNWTTTV